MTAQDTDDGTVVRTSVHGDIGHVLLDRPTAMNAITVAMGRQLEQALTDLAPSVSVIVVRGAGGNFCVGGDFHELERLRPGGPEALTPLFENFGRACAAVSTLPVPVVAAVEGYAMAGGFELMQACDIALVRADASIADNHVNFGQIPGGGGSQRLPRLVGRQRALGHLLGGERLSGLEAEAWGLAFRSWPAEQFDDGVAAFTGRLAGKDRDALGKIKKLVHDGLGMTLEHGLAHEREAVVEHIGGASAGAGIQGFTKSTGA
ncbi:enoyl-CoA hydratase/isomerase family protein [Streptomyces albus]|uniref:Enoyl-CoA hydratase/isomerase family protein n=1 Tax=Streptomyces albus (strain ATCC 21838 / DSM 41398 / FERM P-419 / JCM 4703 / NBRC 107858) TaxID=1081613 RepID=A0A0B5EER8_STRA4|nr:enoyl-CoA hydratase/isomerase family protein [Streptomyces albus]AOU74753.1 enoyl-CoA hydratase/isomerase family protein [Streptomyces albus]AYN30564.1 enoyl-CoA hydratase/isomerase family protein [Streptomyces albus]